MATWPTHVQLTLLVALSALGWTGEEALGHRGVLLTLLIALSCCGDCYDQNRLFHLTVVVAVPAPLRARQEAAWILVLVLRARVIPLAPAVGGRTLARAVVEVTRGVIKVVAVQVDGGVGEGFLLACELFTNIRAGGAAGS